MQQINIEVPQLSNHIEEAYKSLRTNLMFCGKEKKVIDITSCMEDEGKSTVAHLLAISLAQSGKRVILVDADMRKSVLTGSVHVQGRHKLGGLSLYLSGQAYVNDIICETNIPGFYMIFTGPFPPNPAELLLSERFDLMIAALKKNFDYVILDTPPLGIVTDSAIVADKCDGSILVIEAGAIGYQFAQDVVAQLEKADCPILGTVLNKVDPRHNGSYYGGKYYRKYYGKYYGKYGKYGGYGYGQYGYGASNTKKAREAERERKAEVKKAEAKKSEAVSQFQTTASPRYTSAAEEAAASHVTPSSRYSDSTRRGGQS